ncbi:MAG: UDP binding domain-containing protein, partial [Propionibacteriaceae bacterium]|nr:UDP binding domain-containing protein [Propionibacteriaceae bacterium]
LVKKMTQEAIQVRGARVLILGLTFKENTPDLRNTRVVDIIDELKEYEIHVDVHDPWADAREAKEYYGIELVSEPMAGAYDGVVLAVAHEQFRANGLTGVKAYASPEGSVIYDLKYSLPHAGTDLRL